MLDLDECPVRTESYLMGERPQGHASRRARTAQRRTQYPRRLDLPRLPHRSPSPVVIARQPEYFENGPGTVSRTIIHPLARHSQRGAAARTRTYRRQCFDHRVAMKATIVDGPVTTIDSVCQTVFY